MPLTTPFSSSSCYQKMGNFSIWTGRKGLIRTTHQTSRKVSEKKGKKTQSRENERIRRTLSVVRTLCAESQAQQPSTYCAEKSFFFWKRTDDTTEEFDGVKATREGKIGTTRLGLMLARGKGRPMRRSIVASLSLSTRHSRRSLGR